MIETLPYALLGLWVLWMTVGMWVFLDWLTARGIRHYERTGQQPWWWPE